MSDMKKPAEVKPSPYPEGTKVKRYSLSSDERMKIDNIQSVMGILALQREGLNYSMTLELARARDRLSIQQKDAPVGFTRSVDYDPNTHELICIDVPTPPKTDETPAPGTPANVGKPVEKTVN